MRQKIYYLAFDVFLKLRLHVLFNPIARVLEIFAQYSHFSTWVRKTNPEIWDTKNINRNNQIRRFQYYDRLAKIENLEKEQLYYLEFGVAKGVSFKYWIQKNKNENSKIFGFDTFTGLPEDWLGYKSGAFSTNGFSPDIDGDTRGQFLKGLFQNSLPDFTKTTDLNRRLIIHLDADIYGATLYVLTQLARFIKKGDILLFDEFNDVMAEFRAFQQFAESFYLKYEVLGSANNYCQMAIKTL